MPVDCFGGFLYKNSVSLLTKRCFVLREKLFGLAEFNEMLVFLLGGLFRLGKELLGALGKALSREV